jgi:hypothetical protein
MAVETDRLLGFLRHEHSQKNIQGESQHIHIRQGEMKNFL